MNIITQEDGEIRGVGWLAGGTGTLLLISLGLELLAHQVFGQTDMATLLLALYLAFWSLGLGIVGYLILSVSWLMDWWRLRANRVATSPQSTTEPRQKHLEGPEQETPQFLQRCLAPAVPIRQSKQSDDKDAQKCFTRAV